MTLEKSKRAVELPVPVSLQEKTRQADLGCTPHQAPQRERVSRALSPQRTRSDQRKQRNWKDCIKPEVNLGVPQLLMLLEPNIVWNHVTGLVPALGKEVEANYSPNSFFEGFHRGGHRANGVYEGSYWALIRDAEELTEMLRKMARAPPLMEEPVLKEPGAPEMPKWDEFKPSLQAIPQPPQLPPLRLAPFKAPILADDLPFVEPELLPLPHLPPTAEEEPLPVFKEPGNLRTMEDFIEPKFVPPEPPAGLKQPQEPKFGDAECGHDWTGERPFQKEVPAYSAPTLLEVAQWTDPDIPPPPPALEIQLEPSEPELQPVPRLELAWACGPAPEPAYSSRPTSPCKTPRAVSPAPPASPPPGTPPRAESPAPRPQTPPLHPPKPERPPSAKVKERPPSAKPDRPVSAKAPSRRATNSERRVTVTASEPVVETMVENPHEELQQRWQEVNDVEGAGQPAAWINFEEPFADLPPIFIPPEPQQGPRPELQPPRDLQPIPTFQDPVLTPIPEYEHPNIGIPQWVPPCEPRPIGFLRGAGPVLILDVSGTMNPVRQGRFKQMKQCVADLLDPATGEVGACCNAFDVIAFAGQAHSWSAGYEGRKSLLAASQTLYSGRQVGGKPGVASRPTSAVPSRPVAVLQASEAELLADAQAWVTNWPMAQGQTDLFKAFDVAAQHGYADCWYIFSDGLAHDMGRCIEWVRLRQAAGLPVPPCHTIGFFREDGDYMGERFLKDLSAITGGVFQQYDPYATRVFDPAAGGFRNFDPQAETPDARKEREWVESRLRDERCRNRKMGISERLDVVVSRVQRSHQAERVGAVLAANEALLKASRRQHEERCTAIAAANDAAWRQARQAHEELVASVKASNKAKVEAADAAHAAAVQAWEEAYEQAVREWREATDLLEAQRQAQAARGGAPSPRSPRPRRPPSAHPSQARLSPRPRPSREPSRESILSPRIAPAAYVTNTLPPAAHVHAAPRPPLSPRGSEVHEVHVSNPGVTISGLFDGSGGGAGGGGGLVPEDSWAVKEDAGKGEDELVVPLIAVPSTVMALEAQQRQEQEPGMYLPHLTASRPQSSKAPSTRSSSRPVSAGGRSLGCLEVHDDEELKRAVLPQEVVDKLDDANERRLQQLRSDWEKTNKVAEERNAKLRQLLSKSEGQQKEYTARIAAIYAEHLVKYVMFGCAAVTVANNMVEAEARAAHQEAVKQVLEYNAEMRAAHAEEVTRRRLLEEEYRQAFADWEAGLEKLMHRHEEDVAQAARVHKLTVEKMWALWEEEKAAMEANNAAKVEAARQQHAIDVEEARARNLARLESFQEAMRERRALEKINNDRLAVARTAHNDKVAALAVENEQILAQAQQEYQELCRSLADQDEVNRQEAQREYEELRTLVQRRNDEMMEEARRTYQRAVEDVQHDHADALAAAEEEYCRECEVAHKHNQAVWPKVQVARLAQSELNRVAAFMEHMRFCANKMELGINFMANTPNLGRVVEMSALMEALGKAFPEEPAGEYPWPDRQKQGERGAGWVESPPTRPVLRRSSVEIEIQKILRQPSPQRQAAQQSRPGSPLRSPKTLTRPATAGSHARSTSTPDDHYSSQRQGPARPKSASAAFRSTQVPKVRLRTDPTSASMLMPESSRGLLLERRETGGLGPLPGDLGVLGPRTAAAAATAAVPAAGSGSTWVKPGRKAARASIAHSSIQSSMRHQLHRPQHQQRSFHGKSWELPRLQYPEVDVTVLPM